MLTTELESPLALAEALPGLRHSLQAEVLEKLVTVIRREIELGRQALEACSFLENPDVLAVWLHNVERTVELALNERDRIKEFVEEFARAP